MYFNIYVYKDVILYVKKHIKWLRWDLNPRTFVTDLKTVSLNHSDTQPSQLF